LFVLVSGYVSSCILSFRVHVKLFCRIVSYRIVSKSLKVVGNVKVYGKPLMISFQHSTVLHVGYPESFPMISVIYPATSLPHRNIAITV